MQDYRSNRRVIGMDKDRIARAAKDVSRSLKRLSAGDATFQSERKAEHAAGKVQNATSELKNALRRAIQK